MSNLQQKIAIHTLFMSMIWNFEPEIHTFSLLTYIGAFLGPLNSKLRKFSQNKVLHLKLLVFIIPNQVVSWAKIWF
jgi:hypothetical protein